jgi:ABC-type transport system involved in multi-copper enzyme maturation permease subunit
MNAGYGTTIIDYISNGVSIVFPALAIFIVFVTAFCILADIRAGTIVGSVASPHSRRKIIWTKELAVLLAAGALVLAYCLFFTVIGAIVLGGVAAPPPVLAIAFGSLVIKTSAVGFLMFQCLVVVLKLFLIVSCVSLMSVAIQNKYTVCIVGVLFAAAFVIADAFLMPFSLYLVLIWPIKSIITGTFLFIMDRKFAKKEF